jgi:hypothetical protein
MKTLKIEINIALILLFIISSFVAGQLFSADPEKSEESHRLKYYGVVIDLPEEINAAANGDTLIVKRVNREGKAPVVSIGFK